MALLKVLTVPDSRLRVRSEPVAHVDDDLRQLMDDMLETMYHEDGAGLAAIQVGVAKRIIVIDLQEPGFIPMRIVNPEIISSSERQTRTEEACLSVPHQSASVERPEAVRVRYMDENNVQHAHEVSGYLARAFQHEIDHLNGVLYVDHLSTLQKSLLLKKSIKSQRR